MIGKNGKSNNISRSAILLIDSDSNLSKIKTTKKDFHWNKIISFDYDSHKNLNLENIEHEISDEFITQEETNEIQIIFILLVNGIMKNLFKNFLWLEG